MHKIFVVEDHQVIRQAYTQLIESEPDLTVCGQAGTAAEALRQIPLARPDLIIVDVSLADTNGLELVKQLQLQQPTLPALVISGHEESFYAKKALEAGAKGYVMKNKVRLILTAIRQVLSGHSYG